MRAVAAADELESAHRLLDEWEQTRAQARAAELRFERQLERCEAARAGLTEIIGALSRPAVAWALSRAEQRTLRLTDSGALISSHPDRPAIDAVLACLWRHVRRARDGEGRWQCDIDDAGVRITATGSRKTLMSMESVALMQREAVGDVVGQQVLGALAEQDPRVADLVAALERWAALDRARARRLDDANILHARAHDLAGTAYDHVLSLTAGRLPSGAQLEIDVASGPRGDLDGAAMKLLTRADELARTMPAMREQTLDAWMTRSETGRGAARRRIWT